MPHRYQDDVTRVRARDVARVSLAVLFLAFMGGAYLSAWTGLPAWLALGATLSLLSAWTVRQHRRRLQGVRDLCFHIDSEQLSVESAGRKCTIVEREQVRAITHDGTTWLRYTTSGQSRCFASAWAPSKTVGTSGNNCKAGLRSERYREGSFHYLNRSEHSPWWPSFSQVRCTSTNRSLWPGSDSSLLVFSLGTCEIPGAIALPRSQRAARSGLPWC